MNLFLEQLTNINFSLFNSKFKENCFETFPSMCEFIDIYRPEQNHKHVLLRTPQGYLENLYTSLRK